jgi:hypothetical protein
MERWNLNVEPGNVEPGTSWGTRGSHLVAFLSR